MLPHRFSERGGRVWEWLLHLSRPILGLAGWSAGRFVDRCEQQVKTLAPGDIANIKPPGASYWLTMAHKLAGDDPGMFPSRRLIRQIHPIGVADRPLCGLEIEKKDRHR